MGKGIAAAALSAAFFASGVIFVRYAYQAGLAPGTALVLRFGLAAGILLVMLKAGKRWVRLPVQEAGVLYVLGLLVYTAMGVTWFVSLSIIPAWLVALFTAIQPVAVILGSWLFLKGDVSRRLLLPLGIVVVGGGLLFWQPLEKFSMLGVWLMILNLLAYCVYILIGQGWINRRAPEPAIFWIMCGAATGSLVYAAWVNELNFRFEPVGWLWAFCLALFSTVLAITFLWAGIRTLGPARTSIISALDPVFSLILALVVLGERLSGQQVMGAVLIFAGVIIVRLLG